MVQARGDNKDNQTVEMEGFTVYKILIVEDDNIIAKSIKRHIETWGCEAEYITDFENVISAFVAYDPQLVLLDIALPFFNGYYWCAEIRKISKVPIIFISSASDSMNIVMAVNMGGDDFIAKPFDLAVLTAKVQAMLRRSYDFTGKTNLMEHKGAILNISDATLTYNGEKIELTKNDFRILQTLMENKGQAVSRDALMIKLWETDSFVDENTLTVNITRLRRKLEAAGLNDFITTKKGIGYLVE
jgi:two-component system, OmpR family, response regulator protein BraR/BceR